MDVNKQVKTNIFSPPVNSRRHSKQLASLPGASNKRIKEHLYQVAIHGCDLLLSHSNAFGFANAFLLFIRY
ncbi:hypothetical protein FHW67_000077 [Herbaspirillum sp. Sphag1AN]|nr:hypothetical protein [Herbaspirillum sp. Sphag1AN]MBB3244472.1 hypothetical protein [Herbaspirillum sp. Sphag64]